MDNEAILRSKVKRATRPLCHRLMDKVIINFEKFATTHNFFCGGGACTYDDLTNPDPSSSSFSSSTGTSLPVTPYLLAKLLRRSYEIGWMIGQDHLKLCLERDATFWSGVELNWHPFYPLDSCVLRLTRNPNERPITTYVYNRGVTLKEVTDLSHQVASFEVLSFRLRFPVDSNDFLVGPGLKNLKKLSLDLTHVTHLPLVFDFECFAGTLEILDLEFGKLNENQMEEIGKLKNLQHLSLFGSFIRNARTLAVAISCLDELRTLDLGECYSFTNHLTDDLMRSIGSLKNLETLNLSGSQAVITERALSHLRGKKFKLLGLYTRNNRVEYNEVKDMANHVVGSYGMRSLIKALTFHDRRDCLSKLIIIEIVLSGDGLNATKEETKRLEEIVLRGLARFKSSEFCISRLSALAEAIVHKSSQEFTIRLASLITSIIKDEKRKMSLHFGYKSRTIDALARVVTDSVSISRPVINYILRGECGELASKFFEFLVTHYELSEYTLFRAGLAEACSFVITNNLFGGRYRELADKILKRFNLATQETEDNLDDTL